MPRLVMNDSTYSRELGFLPRGRTVSVDEETAERWVRIGLAHVRGLPNPSPPVDMQWNIEAAYMRGKFFGDPNADPEDEDEDEEAKPRPEPEPQPDPVAEYVPPITARRTVVAKRRV